MNSHNSKPAFVFHETPVAGKDDKDEAYLVSASLNATDLALADESDDFLRPVQLDGRAVHPESKADPTGPGLVRCC